jgi:hypothetical protein
VRLRDIRPEDRTLGDERGLLIQNTSRTRDDDADLIGTLKTQGRVIQLRGFIVTTEAGAQVIRLVAS